MKKCVHAWLMIVALTSGVAHAQLNDLGNGLINHPAADMTWTSDGNLFRTQATASATLVADVIAAWNGQQLPFDHVLVAADFDTSNGAMTYFGALAWINYLNATNYKGYNDWRLPDIGVPRAPGFCGGACYPSHGIPVDSSEWFRLFYQELGGVEGVSIHTTHNANYDLFVQIGSGWSLNVTGDLANQFFQNGGQGRNNLALSAGVWPVRTGVSVINPPPMPRLTLSKIEVVFPAPQITLTRSPPQSVTLTNRGTAPSVITAMTTTSPVQPDEFVVSHDCPASLAVGASCTASVTFRPQSIGTNRGSLAIEADGKTYTVALEGTGALGVELNASAATATAGANVDLTWSASTTDIQGCTASGGSPGDGWSGPLPSGSGTRAVTATTAGNVTYEVACTARTGGATVSDSVTVAYTVPAVTLVAASTNIQQGVANNLTWTSTNAGACTATGNGVAGQWGGALALNGTASVVEATLGSITYTVTCTAAARTASASVSVFVSAPPDPPEPGGGGGGSIEWLSLLGLLALMARRAASGWRWRDRPGAG